MPLSYLRRPLAVVLIAYMALLALLRCWGAFRTAVAAEWAARTRWRCVRLEATVVSGFTENRLGERLEVRADRAGPCGAAASVGAGRPAEALVYLPTGGWVNDRLRPGQRVAAEGKLRLPRRPLMPGDFDEKGFLEDRGIGLVLHARRLEILRATVGPRWLAAYGAESVHRSIHRLLRDSYRPDVAGVLEGLLLGYKGPLDPEVDRAVQDAGVMHLLVPSGAKVAFILGFVWWAAAGLPGLARLLILAAAGGFYVIVVGLGPPYLRAYLGMLAALAARTVDRDCEGFQALVVSALALLLLRPRDLFTAGFQMSYAAVLGLVVAAPRGLSIRSAAPRGAVAAASRLQWLRAAGGLLASSLIVQLMLAPIMARAFGRVSAAGLLANLLLIPASGVFMALGFATWAASCVATGGLVHAAQRGLGWLTELFIGTCGVFASVPAAAFRMRPLGGLETAAYYAAVGGFLVLPRRRRSAAAFAGAAVLAAAAWFAERRGRPDARIVVFGRGTGGGAWLAALAELPDGRRVLVDGGVPEASRARALGALGWGQVDALIPLRNAERPVELAAGAARLRFIGPAAAVVRAPAASGRAQGVRPLARSLPHSSGRGRAGGEAPGAEFCILSAPLRDAPEACLSERVFDVNKDGAVWISSYGPRASVSTQRELYSLGRLVP